MGSAWGNEDDLVFVTGTGQPMGVHNVRRDLKRILRSKGLLDGRPRHPLRDGLAKRPLEKGLPVQVVSGSATQSGSRSTPTGM